MAATVTVTDALNTSLGEHIAGDENPLNALGIVKVEFVSMAARTTPLPSRSSTPPGHTTNLRQPDPHGNTPGCRRGYD